jgi:hypothetical protein
MSRSGSFLILLMLAAGTALAQPNYPVLQEVFSSDIANYDNLGQRVGLSGNGRTLVVGAPKEDANGSQSGAAYLFIYDYNTQTWKQRAKLAPFDGGAGDLFGSSVAISTDGSTVIVGAPNDDDNGLESGSAYVFERGSGWVSTSQYALKLHPSDSSFLEFFGHSVDVSNNGSTVIVSATWDDDVGWQRGSAYVYERQGNSWTAPPAEAKLTASDTQDQDYFGEDVAIAGDASTVIVGAMHDDNLGNQSGSAYIFERGAGWSTTNAFTARLNAVDGAPNDNFGNAVDINGDGSTVIVGAYRDDDTWSNSGGAYIFERGAGWTTTSAFTAKLISHENTGASNAWMGYDVAISANGATVVVGCPGHIHGPAWPNGVPHAAYIYEKPAGGWVGMTVADLELQVHDNAYIHEFGSSVAISANRQFIAVGDPGDGDMPPPAAAHLRSGSIYMFGPTTGLQPSIISNPDLNGDGNPDHSTAIQITSPPLRPWTLVTVNRGALVDPVGELVSQIVVGSGTPPPGTLYFIEDPPGTYTVEFDSFDGYDLVFSDGWEELRIATEPPLPPGTDGTPMTVQEFDGELLLDWNAACDSAADYQILHGSVFPAAYLEPLALEGAVCSIGPPPYAWVASPDPLPGELLWWLVVATDGDFIEGAWGRDSSGSERAGTSNLCGITEKTLANSCGQ